MTSDLTAQALRYILRYDPETGVFTWLARVGHDALRWNKRYAGKEAGTLGSCEYRRIKIDGRFYKAHRLAWLYVKGEWPSGWIDHRDRDTLNNRWDNLRIASPSLNALNRSAISVRASGTRWIARIGWKGRRYYLGTFDTEEQARSVYLAEKARMLEP